MNYLFSALVAALLVTVAGCSGSDERARYQSLLKEVEMDSKAIGLSLQIYDNADSDTRKSLLASAEKNAREYKEFAAQSEDE